jgi:hypothetical protein
MPGQTVDIILPIFRRPHAIGWLDPDPGVAWPSLSARDAALPSRGSGG